jgi:hypothetical protein
MDTKRKLTKPIPAAFFSFVFMLLTSGLFAQNGQEVNKTVEYQQKKRDREDYTLIHLKNKWELSAGYGRWYFSEASKSGNPDELFFLPNMGTGTFSVTWHFHEKFSTNLTVGLQFKKDIPASPGLLRVISGEEIKIEGSGGGFIPLEAGLKYNFTGRRLSPYIQASAGLVLGKSQYTIVEGNIFEGISRTDFVFNATAPLAGISSGIDYRLDNHFMLELDLKYSLSGKFDSAIGGYERYSGCAVSIKGIVIL